MFTQLMNTMMTNMRMFSNCNPNQQFTPAGARHHTPQDRINPSQFPVDANALPQQRTSGLRRSTNINGNRMSTRDASLEELEEILEKENRARSIGNVIYRERLKI